MKRVCKIFVETFQMKIPSPRNNARDPQVADAIAMRTTETIIGNRDTPIANSSATISDIPKELFK